MTFNEEIKALIDASVDQPTMVQIANVEQCVSKIYSHVLCGYQQSRECVQYAIGQLNRINKPAVVKMIFMAMEAIDKMQVSFLILLQIICHILMGKLMKIMFFSFSTR